MSARVEITGKYARAYRQARRKVKSQILDQVVELTGWSRDNARRRLTKRITGPVARPGVKPKRVRTGKYGYGTLKVLQQVWAASGGMCGKYLAQAMAGLIVNMENHGHLVDGQDRYSPEVRTELLAMSPATIDRYLRSTKARDPLRGKSTTKPGSMLRNSITIRRAGDEVEQEPGFFEADTVAHCGPTAKGEFTRSVNLTDVHVGWVFTTSVRNNARVHIIAALNLAVEMIPYQVQGLDFDNGSEFINHDLVKWAGDRDVYFTRGRPYKKNDQATIESKNGHLVRRYGFYWRYDTAAELAVLRELWPLVNDRLNYFTPTKKPVGWSTNKTGRRKRLNDTPATPFDRLLRAGVLSPVQQTKLTAYRDSLDLVDLAERISECQRRLIKLAAGKTRRLEDSLRPKLPNPDTGIRIRGQK